MTVIDTPALLAPAFGRVTYEPPRDSDPLRPDVRVPPPRRPARPPDPRAAERERARVLLARRRAGLSVRIALEILDGRRPLHHLVPHAAPPVLRYVAAGLPHLGVTGPAALLSLRTALPSRSAAEVSAVCRFGPRVRALAARLELRADGTWRCETLRVL